MGKEPLRILIAGAAGKCGSVLARFTAMGELLGHGQPVILHLLDIPSDAEALIGLKKELENDAFPLIKGVVATTDVVEGCTGVNHAIIVGGFLWKEGMKRTYVMSQAIEQHAAANCKVMVAANLPYASVVIMREFAASIPEENITCTTRLEQNIALRLISERLSVPVSNIKNVTIRGNFSSTLYPDVNHATVKTPSGEKHVRELVADDAWLDGEFIATVQQHAAAIIEDGTLSSALFLASSACDHVRDLVLGTPEGTWVSMGVFSDGSYNVPAGLIHSFPVTCHNGQWMIVQGRSTDKCSWEKFFKIMICVVIVIFLFTTYSAVRGVVRGVAH